MSTEVTEPFGSQLYDELRRISGFSAIVPTLKYDAIQRLKQADREGVIRIFANSGLDVEEAIGTQTPAEAAQSIWDRVQQNPTGHSLSPLDFVILIFECFTLF